MCVWLSVSLLLPLLFSFFFFFLSLSTKYQVHPQETAKECVASLWFAEKRKDKKEILQRQYSTSLKKPLSISLSLSFPPFFPPSFSPFLPASLPHSIQY